MYVIPLNSLISSLYSTRQYLQHSGIAPSICLAWKNFTHLLIILYPLMPITFPCKFPALLQSAVLFFKKSPSPFLILVCTTLLNTHLYSVLFYFFLIISCEFCITITLTLSSLTLHSKLSHN